MQLSAKTDKSFYGEDLTRSKKIWIEDRGETVSPAQIQRTPRIGIVMRSLLVPEKMAVSGLNQKK